MIFTLIAHRGFSSRAPENTAEAFDLALEHGFPHFELDAQLTRDKELVVIHDADLTRTTDGNGLVAEHTLQDLRKLNAAAGFQGTRRDQPLRIPTLGEVLDRYHGRAHLHLELKSREAELPGRVAQALESHGWLAFAGRPPDEAPGITVSSFWADQLYRSALRLPQVRHGWLVYEASTESLDAAAKLGFHGVYPNAATVSSEIVATARARGLILRCWGLRNTDQLTHLVDAGVAGTTVDWPDVARDHLAKVRDGENPNLSGAC